MGDLSKVPQISARDLVRGDGTADAIADVALRGARYVVTRHLKPAGALVSIADLELLLRLDGWSWSELELVKQMARESVPPEENEDGRPV